MKRSDGLLRQGVDVRFAFIDAYRQEWPVRVMCSVLEVSPSGYYAWRKRPESATAQRRRRLTVLIKAIHAESRRNYGSPRVFEELRARGESCNVKTVATIMRENDLVAKRRRKFKVTTDSKHGLPVAENLLDRQFTVTAPNRVWVSDITYIPTWEGRLYLATVQDLFSRNIVGWSMSERMTRELVIDALEMAVDHRRPEPGLLCHSDRGSQYASHDYQAVLARHGMICSMSRKGDCWDNSVMESFYSTLLTPAQPMSEGDLREPGFPGLPLVGRGSLTMQTSIKTELIHHEVFRTRDEARRAVFEYIEMFYNRSRRHLTLGYLSPVDFELAA